VTLRNRRADACIEIFALRACVPKGAAQCDRIQSYGG